MAVAIILGLVCTAHAAHHTGVSLDDAIAQAQQVASLDPTWHVMLGGGSSMDPFYDDASVLIVADTPYQELKAGMIVVYRDSTGDLVGHQLVAKSGEQWQARGYRNIKNDPEVVRMDNYVGVIFGVLYTAASRTEYAALAYGGGMETVVGKKF